MDALDIGRMVLALIFVIGLIGGFGWVGRRLGWLSLFRTPESRLEVLDTLTLDPRTRLVLTRVDAEEYLALISPTGTSLTGPLKPGDVEKALHPVGPATVHSLDRAAS